MGKKYFAPHLARPGKLVFAVVLFLLTVSCTRPENDTSKAQISISSLMNSQKETALSGKTLGHIALNISASDLREPIVYSWDANDQGTTQTPPSSLQFDVPQGPARLIQILAIYKDDTSGSMLFYYGDTKQDFYHTEESVTLAVNSIGAGDAVSGRVSGRYLNGSAVEYTGPLLIKYTPADKPSVIVSRSTIFSGWFNVFMMEGSSLAKFSYELEDGTKLWGRAVNLSDTEFGPGKAVMKVAMPVRWRMKTGSNGHYSWEQEEAQVYAYGFFGPGVSAFNVICRPDSNSTDLSSLPALPNYSVFTGSKPADDTDLPDLPGNFLVSSSLPTAAELLSVATPFASFSVKGGLKPGDSLCIGGTEWSTKISLGNLYTYLINGNGNDSSSAHFAPFTRSATTGPVAISSSGSDYLIAGELLPGLYGLFVDHLIIFKKVSTESAHFKDDFIPCRLLAAGGFGFDKVGDYTLVSSSFSGVSLNITAADKSALGAGPNIVVCPAKGPLIYDAGFLLGKDHFQ